LSVKHENLERNDRKILDVQRTILEFGSTIGTTANSRFWTGKQTR